MSMTLEQPAQQSGAGVRFLPEAQCLADFFFSLLSNFLDSFAQMGGVATPTEHVP